MNPPAHAARRAGKSPSPEALLAAACRIVATEGLAGLTLRPLAEALGVSVTVLTNQHGDRAGIMAAVCAAAQAHDAAVADGWRATLAALGPLPSPVAAGLAESMLEEAATAQREPALLYLEMLHACTWDASLRPAFAGWAAARRAFWDGFARQAGLPAAMVDCGWWHGYVVAELAYSLALDGDPRYRMVRRLCLQRLFDGAVARSPAAADGALFALLRERMRYVGQVAVAGAPAGEMPVAAGRAVRTPAWAGAAARACGIRLAAQGVSGLTHRAIATDIGVAHTTLSYRFPTQHDLVIAGLESIAAHILSAVEAGDLDDLQRVRTAGDGAKLDLARGNFAVALAAARLPALAPYTAHMRTRRGNHLIRVFAQYLPGAQGIDALCAQVISMGLTGLTNTEPPGDPSNRSVEAAFRAAAGWLGRQG